MKAKNYCPEYEKYKTIRQWALLGQLPKKDAKGVELGRIRIAKLHMCTTALMR